LRGHPVDETVGLPRAHMGVPHRRGDKSSRRASTTAIVERGPRAAGGMKHAAGTRDHSAGTIGA
jgi:hypothetical protein